MKHFYQNFSLLVEFLSWWWVIIDDYIHQWLIFAWTFKLCTCFGSLSCRLSLSLYHQFTVRWWSDHDGNDEGLQWFREWGRLELFGGCKRWWAHTICWLALKWRYKRQTAKDLNRIYLELNVIDICHFLSIKWRFEGPMRDSIVSEQTALQGIDGCWLWQ